ncbi:MAG: hypothetical protein PUG55_04495 [Bacillales bacterium]|nr:hypothetical protein [Bacillales bacterium]
MKNKAFIPLLFSLLVLSSCNSTSPITSTSTGDSSTTSTSIPDPISLETAIENTSYYNLYFTPDANSGYIDKKYVEIYSETDYYYLYKDLGFVILDSDPDFVHQYSIDVSNDGQVNMYGRIEGKSYLTNVISQSQKFIDYLKEYQVLFEESEDDPWLYTYYGNGISSTLKNFFQLHGISYCNYYEIRIGYDGRISNFNAGETYDENHDDLIITSEFSFEEGGIKNTDAYQNWVNNGSQIELRIIDLKSVYVNKFRYSPCYSEAEIEAIVTNVDFDGSFYISIEDNYTGPIGMKVIPASDTYKPSINDIVKVSGNIKVEADYSSKEGHSPYFYDAEVTKTSSSYYTPIFSEEALVDQMGAGTYAAYLLSSNPVYSGSLYTGYGYAYDIPSSINTNEDVTFDIICPDYICDENNNPFIMQLIVPSSLGETKINEIYEEIKSLGDYKVDDKNAKLVSLNNCMYYFNFQAAANNKLGGKIYVTPTSIISHRLSFDELIENEYGITNFPTIINDTNVTFHFGHSSQFFLEELYGSDDKNGNGLFYQVNCTSNEASQYLDDILSMENVAFIDGYQYSFAVSYQHFLFQLNDVYIDVVPIVEDTSATVYTFIYRNDKPIRSKSIQEKIDEHCSSFFDSNEFIKLDGTYDINYHFYSLSSYAGHRFDDNNKLSVATMDLSVDRFKELRDAYRKIGYKQYRVDINDPYSEVYSYITRGVSHVVYYKPNDNGKYTFLDFAQYPTTDYTFAGHNTFNYRVEILIYEGTEPMKTNYETNLSEFVSYCVGESGAFNWVLPNQYKAEIYYPQTDLVGNRFYDYGYTFNADAFIYPNSISDLDNCYNYVINTFTSHGFVHSYDGNKGSCYSYTDTENQYGYFVYIMKDSRGFVRIINSIGGIDF